MGHIGYKGPGKYEGEPCYAEQFYDGEGGDGEFYDGDTLVTRLTVTAENVALCPCCLTSEDVDRVVFLGQDNNGFVWTRILSAAEADKIETACNEQPDKDND